MLRRIAGRNALSDIKYFARMPGNVSSVNAEERF